MVPGTLYMLTRRALRGANTVQVAWLLSGGGVHSGARYLRGQRLWLSRRTALVFEDVLPNELEPLKLSEY